MPQYYRPMRSGSARDYYAMSMRHMGASDRDWRAGSNKGKRVIETKKKSNRFYYYIAGGVLLVICIVVIVIVALQNKKPDTPSDDPHACPPGLSGDNCDSTSFIGSYTWTGDSLYKLADGNYYKKGIAFRVFAPNATKVHVLASVPGGIEGEYAMMLEFGWFHELQ